MKIHVEFNSLSEVASFARNFNQFDVTPPKEVENKNDWKWKYERTAANLERALMRISVLDPQGKSANFPLEKDGTHIDELELSTRASNCLKAAGILTIEQLVNTHRYELMKIDNLGKTTLKEIIEALNGRGMTIKGVA